MVVVIIVEEATVLQGYWYCCKMCEAKAIVRKWGLSIKEVTADVVCADMKLVAMSTSVVILMQSKIDSIGRYKTKPLISGNNR